MDAFLTAALAPKPKPKRKSTSLANGQDSSSSSSSSSQKTSHDAAKRPRPRGDSLLTETAFVAQREKTKPLAERGARRPEAPLPSFLDAVSGHGLAKGSTRARLLLDKAVQLQEKGRLDDARSLLLRALVACVCLAPLRRQFKDAGVPLDAIDPIGQCSCRDFVAAARTRRSNAMVASRGAAGDEGDPFPITELDLTAVYGLATDGAACTCGSGRTRCAEPDHLAALDRLAAVASKLGRADEARRAAQWYVDLAPQHAQGYLHAAKAVLAAAAAKKKDGRPKDAVRREYERARFAARCLYTHGLHNVRAHGDASSDLARVLARCCRQYSHDDYLPDLPVETVEAIFQHLSFRDVLACRRVSRRWALVLRRVRLRPAQICFRGKKDAPVQGLQKLLRQMPGLQTDHLTIAYDGKAAKTAQFVTVALRHFQNTANLDLTLWETAAARARWVPPAAATKQDNDGTADRRAGEAAAASTTMVAVLGEAPLPPLPAVSSCRHLLLRVPPNNFGMHTPAACLIAWASASLESLELCGLFRYDDPLDFRLARLRHLKIIHGTWASDDRHELCFPMRLCTAAARLEQLFLDAVTFHTTNHYEADLVSALEEGLQHLHTLVVGSTCRVQRSQGNDYGLPSPFLLFPRLPRGMRCLDLLCAPEHLAHGLLFGGHYDPRSSAPIADLAPLEHLEAFRCLAPVSEPAHLFQLIEPSLCGPAGRLVHFEMNARDVDASFLRNQSPRMRFPQPERLRTVGLYDFRWTPTSFAYGLRDRVFLDWVALFPNAEAVSVYPHWRYDSGSDAEGGALVVALVEQAIRQAEAAASQVERGAQDDAAPASAHNHLKLRTIYQSMLSGVMREKAAAVIGSWPIQIPAKCHDFRPPVFPWPDRDDEPRSG